MSKTQKARGVNEKAKVGGWNSPPKETRWKKGCSSPNPAGRPPSKHINQIAKEFGEQAHGKTGRSKDEHIIEMLYRRGCQGDDRAASLYLGYRWGRPVEQTVNLNENTNSTKMTMEEADAFIKAYLGQSPTFVIA
jgi:hypothetical protein